MDTAVQEAPTGYRQTEIGMIPESWELKKLGSLSSFITKGTTPTTYGFKWETEGIRFLRSECVSDQGLDLTQSMFISPEAHSSLIRGEVRSGDILMTITGNVGRVIFLKSDFGTANINQHIARIRVNNSRVYTDYVYHFLSQPKVRTYYGSITTGQAYPQISLKQVRETQIVLPALPEQQAIATVLSDADALLAGLQKLIAKKRTIKQGTMQELLTGKRRLPGFSGKWEVKPIRSISYLKGRIGWQGLKQSEFTMNPDEPFLITGMNFKDGEIKWDDVYHVSFERYEVAKDIQLRPDDILMTKDGTIGKLLFITSIPYPGKATLNSHLVVFRPIKDSYFPKFLYYHFASKAFADYIELKKSGSTFFGISQEAIEQYPVFLPPSIREQVAIAGVLSDMDAEINTLERKLSKYKALKQGMMQVLLTGKIRLPH